MDSSKKEESNYTPRRSTRLQQKQREMTPERTSQSAYKPKGPRAMAKINKTKLNQTLPSIVITSPEKKKDPVQTPEVAEEKKSNEEQTEREEIKAEEVSTTETQEQPNEINVQEASAQEPKEIKAEEVSATETDVQKEPEEETQVTKDQEIPEKLETYAEVVAHPIKDEEVAAPKQPENILNITPQLMDESIISVAESIDMTAPAKDATFSPEPNKSVQPTKNTTFSPVVDKSINDSRPHIDVESNESEFNTTPIHRNVTHRTSTPLAQKLFKRETPKPGTAVMSALAKVFSPKVNASAIETLDETVNGQFKLVNQFEKSILKSTRKRSLSVTDCESFVRKKVMFVSPKIVDTGEIDERMMESFRKEKENSILLTQKSSGTRRKRSLSASETPVPKKTPKKHMPDFKAIHEAQFKKMESIWEHKQRKAERAKKLITPSKSLPVGTEEQPQQSQPTKIAVASKIPKASRKPLVIKPPTENAQAARPLKRSFSAEPQTSVIKKSSFVPTLPRAMSQEIIKPKIKFPPIKTEPSVHLKKTDERREKNKAMYKTNVTRTGSNDIRKKNETFIKGVRLNRRFELMMQNRMAHGSADHNDD